MANRTALQTVSLNLCISCGICGAVCPKHCITWEQKKGLHIPNIDLSSCVQCGLCSDVCPGLGFSYPFSNSALEAITGQALASYNAWSLDPDLRHVSASGGVISTLVCCLLESGLYDVAFSLDSYDYYHQLSTTPKTKTDYSVSWPESFLPKSRYLPVSHENTIAYIKAHPDSKAIFIGTSCAVRGFLSSIEKLKLNRDNYLVIGLFCDRVFNYNVLSYFQDTFCDGRQISTLHFKNKESGGWPGNMKFHLSDDTHFYLDKSERIKVKDYFMPERCLYCIDKLNVSADISLGDNYTDLNSSPLGSNSVVIRTPRGQAAWDAAASALESHPVPLKKIQTAQDLNWRLNNLYFGALKEEKTSFPLSLNQNVPLTHRPVDYERAWHHNLKTLNIGSVYAERPKVLQQQFKTNTNPNLLCQFLERTFYFLKRKFG